MSTRAMGRPLTAYEIHVLVNHEIQLMAKNTDSYDPAYIRARAENILEYYRGLESFDDI